VRVIAPMNSGFNVKFALAVAALQQPENSFSVALQQQVVCATTVAISCCNTGTVAPVL
jgi:hypothetical protein